MKFSFPPVIAIDGPTASGKGTVAQRLAERLQFHYLDSGALYRLVALKVQQQQIVPSNEEAVYLIAHTLNCQFLEEKIFLDGAEVGQDIRAENVGQIASQIAALPLVRQALIKRQQDFRIPPGLVADGRDMGTSIFPDALLKVFLTASVETRAQRRYAQLIKQGFSVSMADLLQGLRERDLRDANRAASPLKAAPDARLLDSSALNVEAVVDTIYHWYQELTRSSSNA